MDRRILATVAVAAVMVTAGCGFLLGNEPATFSASPATVSDDALSESGYEETNVTEQNVSREVEAAGQTREVVVTNHMAQYERSVGVAGLAEQKAAAFVAFSSPQISVAGQSFNPLDGMSEREILTKFNTQHSNVQVEEQTGSRNLSVLGETRTVKQFAGTTELNGQEVDVVIHAAKFKHGDDHIGAIAIYPERADGEAERAVTMYEGLEHDG